MEDIAYLGPKGSFSNLIAQKRFPRATLTPRPSITAVIEHVRTGPARRGIVPIENSSGGMILDAVDILVDHSFALVIQEELVMHVRLAFLGRKGKQVNVIYSHFAPLHHCGGWIRRNHPAAEVRRVASTSEAVRIAAREKGAAALATRAAAALYDLDILEFPVERRILNVTQFFVLGHHPNPHNPTQTSLVVALKNRCGSLCEFLKAFAGEKVNLKRIVSRNVVGQPNTYVFFVGVEAAGDEARMRRALLRSRRAAVEVRSLGSYPVKRPYFS